MTPAIVGVLFLFCMCLGTWAGGVIQQKLPDHHLDTDSRDTMKLGVGLIATLTALVLGLVTADAKGTFQTMDMTTKTMSADVIMLDRYLTHYGPETAPVREAFKSHIQHRVEEIWQLDDPLLGGTGKIINNTYDFEVLENTIFNLPQITEQQKYYRNKALEAVDTAFKKRWLFIAESGATGLPIPFMLALVLWLTIIFGSFGLYAPRNKTVMAIMTACGFSVACSVFLILEMGEPFTGIIKISPKPLLVALEMMGQ